MTNLYNGDIAKYGRPEESDHVASHPNEVGKRQAKLEKAAGKVPCHLPKATEAAVDENGDLGGQEEDP